MVVMSESLVQNRRACLVTYRTQLGGGEEWSCDGGISNAMRCRRGFGGGEYKVQVPSKVTGGGQTGTTVR